jgi:DUF4097 and DUF4098 domain-containing protein YvlB
MMKNMKNRSYKRIVCMMILIMAVIAAAVIGGLNRMRDINEEKSISINEINAIRVDMTSIRVHFIRTKTGNEVKANFHGKAMQEIELITNTDKDTLFITVQRRHENLPIYEDVALDVSIPEIYTKNLSIKMLSGDVKIDPLNLESLIFHTSSGKLEAEQIKAGEIAVTSASGSIKMDDCNAKKTKIITSSGNITLKNSVGDLDLKSSSGKVQADYMNFENQNMKIETASGSVKLELPDTAEFLVEAKTSSGDFKSDFPIQITNKKDVNGQIGTKNNTIMLQTLSGSMKICKK